MATTTPPFAVPSSLVTTMPVTPIAWLNCSAWRTRVLAEARVEDQQHLVRRIAIEPLHDARDLRQLVHQVRLRMQAPRGVGDQHVGAARLRRLQRVEYDGRGIRAGRLRDDRHAVALRPDGELLDGGGAEGVAGREHHLRVPRP